MISDRYVWLLVSLTLLVPWIALYVRFPPLRRTMLWAGLLTAPFGLTEPLFVPEYWNPPSVFDLAQRTGFDIESLIFSFGIGGVASVLYAILTHQMLRPMTAAERRALLHRRHWLAIASPFLAFPLLLLLPWNPIYAGIVAMAVGAVATMLCRPDLRRTSWVGAVVFTGYYLVFLVALEVASPGYIARVWNLPSLSGIQPFGLPIEEILFAVTFGLYWSGLFDHLTWHVPSQDGALGRNEAS